MKKGLKKASLAVLLVFTLSILLAGCGGSGDADKKADSQSGEKVKAGFIYIGSANDGGYSQVHDEGRQEMLANIGEDKVETLVREDVPEDQTVENVMNEMIDQGANIIFANSYNYQDYMKKVAEANPDVKFMHFSGSILGDNYGNYFGRMYQPRYLTGIAAGLTTQNNKIGYVAAMQTPEVIRGINAFTLGVRSVNPDATVQVVWTNTWYDPAVEKQAAESLLDAGVDTIAQHQDTTAAQQAAADRGAFSVGYNKDMREANPEGFIASPVWHLGALYTEQVQAVVDGTWAPSVYWGGIADGVVDISDFGDCVSEETKAAVNEAREKIVNGEFDVFTGEIKDQNGEVKVAEGQKLSDEELLSMMWFVEGVIGEIGAK
ncbi:MAG: BMP family ABC transporter substrate-binding protein [Peptococcaceae bacterium]